MLCETMSKIMEPRLGSFFAVIFYRDSLLNYNKLYLNQMNDPKVDKAETKPLVKISNKVIEIEEYESVMRQSRKVLTRMDEVLDNSTNITPEETSDWKEYWKNLKDSSAKKPD